MEDIRPNALDIAFNVLKIRYAEYDRMIQMNGCSLQPGDRINVFINLESAFKNVSMIPDLENHLMTQRNFEATIASDILNLAGHYKRFFMGNQVDTRVYLYQTDFGSDHYNQLKYNENYRSYFHCKYTQNPRFIYFTDALREKSLPLVKTCCEFIPRVYYISAKNIEGSVIPYVIQQDDLKRNDHRKNFIIGDDFYETQYGMLPGFLNHYVKRFGVKRPLISCNNREILAELLRIPVQESEPIVKHFETYAMYTTMISCMGDKLRTIDSVAGVGIKTLLKYISRAESTNRIQENITNPNIISEIFPDDFRQKYTDNFYCSSIPSIYEELTDAEKLSLTSQRKDGIDMQGLLQLNQSIFYHHPLTLEALCN